MYRCGGSTPPLRTSTSIGKGNPYPSEPRTEACVSWYKAHVARTNSSDAPCCVKTCQSNSRRADGNTFFKFKNVSYDTKICASAIALLPPSRIETTKKRKSYRPLWILADCQEWYDCKAPQSPWVGTSCKAAGWSEGDEPLSNNRGG